MFGERQENQTYNVRDGSWEAEFHLSRIGPAALYGGLEETIKKKGPLHLTIRF